MELTVNVKQLPADIIDQLKENLDKLKLFRASNITARDNSDKEWRELFDGLMPVALATIAAIDKCNADQCKISQRIKRAVLRIPRNYKNTPLLLQDIAYNNNRGIDMVRNGSMDYPLLRAYLVKFSPESVATVDRMKALSITFFLCNQAQENTLSKINRLKDIITAVETEYVSMPDIELSALDVLLKLPRHVLTNTL